MSASNNLSPQQFGGDELASKRARKFDALLDQVPTFQEEIDQVAESPKPPRRRPRLRAVK